MMHLELKDVRAHADKYRDELRGLSRLATMVPMLLEALADEVEALRAENARLRAEAERGG